MGSRVLHAPKPQEGGNTDFGKAYYSYCQQRGLSINSTVLTSLLDSKKELWLDAEKLKKEEEWDPVLYALSVGAHEFKEIHVYCNWDSQKYAKRNKSNSTEKSLEHRFVAEGSISKALLPSPLLYTPHLATKLITLIKDALLTTKSLVHLEIVGIPLTLGLVKILARGLAANTTLKTLNLARSHLGDDGFKLLLPTLRTLTLHTLNLSLCNLTSLCASIFAAFLTRQSLERASTAWQKSLRSYEHDFDEPLGVASSQGVRDENSWGVSLRRITLCWNKIGDDGFRDFCDALKDDIGLRALDLQHNPITPSALPLLHTVLSTNPTILIIDLRNTQIPLPLLYDFHAQLTSNAMGTMPKTVNSFLWMDREDCLKGTRHYVCDLRRGLTSGSSMAGATDISRQKSTASISKALGSLSKQERANKPWGSALNLPKTVSIPTAARSRISTPTTTTIPLTSHPATTKHRSHQRPLSKRPKARKKSGKKIASTDTKEFQTNHRDVLAEIQSLKERLASPELSGRLQELLEELKSARRNDARTLNDGESPKKSKSSPTKRKNMTTVWRGDEEVNTDIIQGYDSMLSLLQESHQNLQQAVDKVRARKLNQKSYTHAEDSADESSRADSKSRDPGTWKEKTRVGSAESAPQPQPQPQPQPRKYYSIPAEYLNSSMSSPSDSRSSSPNRNHTSDMIMKRLGERFELLRRQSVEEVLPGQITI